MKIRRALLALVALGALAMAASALAQSGHSAASTVVTTKKTSLGTILVTSSGKTLYLDAHDKLGHPACKGACLSIWPALKARGTLKASGRAKTADLGTTKIAGGIKQVTYNKHPLYTFVSAAKGTSGEGVNGFYVVGTSGNKIIKAAKPTTPTTTTTTTPTTTTTTTPTTTTTTTTATSTTTTSTGYGY
jgi:predicted lipoprotein with Yx(FWY)xxD motif